MPRKKINHNLPSRPPRKFKPADPASKFILPANIPFETGCSLSTVYRMEKAGQFPSRVLLSPQKTGWKREDVQAWQLTRQNRNAAA